MYQKPILYLITVWGKWLQTAFCLFGSLSWTEGFVRNVAVADQELPYWVASCLLNRVLSSESTSAGETTCKCNNSKMRGMGIWNIVLLLKGLFRLDICMYPCASKCPLWIVWVSMALNYYCWRRARNRICLGSKGYVLWTCRGLSLLAYLYPTCP